MILNLLHRMTPGPTYPYFELQQAMAHRLNLKVTVMVQLDGLHDPRLVAEAKRFHAEYGDELGLGLSGFDCPEYRARVGDYESMLWLYSVADKRTILELAVGKFREAFNRDPVSAAAYHLDAVSIQILRELCPAIKIAVVGCFEEGVKVFHGCNHSWYLFNEGMPWGPWYPSRDNSLRPAEDAAEWAGLVAVPHLSRDPALSYEGRNDFFASHPANAQRGLANLGEVHPYDFNLVDLYRLQEVYNTGQAYYHVFVSPGWLAGHPTIQDPIEVCQQLYRELLEYLADLRQQGRLIDMHMSEFADWYRTEVPIGQPEVFLAKEMLYGTGKHYFWYVDPYVRVLIDANLGGSIGDLRPYVGKVACATGADSADLHYGSYPYLIHSQYRTGIAHHFADGARTTLLVTHGSETLDLSLCRTQVADIQRDATGTQVRLTPARLNFMGGFSVEIETTYHLPGQGQIIIARRLTDVSDPAVELRVQEYFKGCYGITEYPVDMHGIQLTVQGDETLALDYTYRHRHVRTSKARAVSARIPQINTGVRLEARHAAALVGQATEGFMFSPFFTLTLDYALSLHTETRSCLHLFPLR